MIKKIFIIISLAFCYSYGFCENSLDMKASLEKKDNGYYLSWAVLMDGFDASLFAEEKIYLINDELIIEGVVDDNKINERDFLFSQKNIDLNGDGDFNDSFLVKLTGDKISINGRDVPTLRRRSGRKELLINMNNSLIDKLIFLKGGTPLFIERTNSDNNNLVVRLASEGIVKQYNNSLVTVEIISREEKIPTIEGLNFTTNMTNEKVFSEDGQWLVRYVGAFNIPVENNMAKMGIFLKGGYKNFILRVRYYFALSNSVIIFGEKILYP